ncbi:hypothetical protein Q4511_15480 [Paracoccus sp. 1_MG-2023]|uniref:hypothetical protein n=1 Tax=unclassified Paracoccus (in: a-proteobacteria) TaxID=2688777 RepID=UPI001C08CCE1|nr:MULTISPECIES: hypothetical protein [unclassified Paracoccus (in: a-proteobacteria)]MBU2958047.1 hypothetical protein [Paracoccus sp. C2R09]MDO6670319.1 hypothetical protein [Paracoccus sp. 1_MG-2023]
MEDPKNLKCSRNRIPVNRPGSLISAGNSSTALVRGQSPTLAGHPPAWWGLIPYIIVEIIRMTTEHTIDYAKVSMKLASLLGRKYRVNIIFSGDDARTDGTTIYLPHWDFSDPRKRNALYGLIFHEAAGHVRHTDFTALQQYSRNRLNSSPKHPNALWHAAANILEDIRIERLGLQLYPGARSYLNSVCSLIFEDYPDATTLDNHWSLALNWSILNFRLRILNQKVLAHHAGLYQQAASSYFGEAMLSQAFEIAHRAALSKSTQDVLHCAEELILVFDQALPDKQPEPPRPPQQGGSKGAQPQDGQQGGSEGTPAQEGQQGGPAEPRTELSKDLPSTSQYSIAECVAKKGADPNNTSSSAIGYIDPANQGVGSNKSSSTSGDDVTDSMRAALSFRQGIIGAVSPMLCGDCEYSAPRRHGRGIDPRQLTRTRTDHDPKIWRNLQVEDDQSVAVQILLDTSGSTRNNNVLIEGKKAALGLASALEQFPMVETAISHFPAKVTSHVALAPFLKPFDRPVSASLTGWPQPSGGTPLEIGYRAAGFNFLLSEKERRILFVVTDGKPDSVHAAQIAKTWLSRLNVEVFGVVVGEGSYPLELFDDSIVIATASELPRAILALTQRNI